MTSTGLAAASGLAAPGAADAGPWLLGGNAGITAGLRFGGPGGVRGVFGFEATAAYVDHSFDCDGAMQTYSGAVMRFELASGGDRRLVFGPVLGRTNGLVGYAVDAGFGVGFGTAHGKVAVLGAEGSGGILLDARAAYAFGRDAQITAGLRFPPLSFSGGCATGRPLRGLDGRLPLAGATQFALPRGLGPGARDADSGSADEAAESSPTARARAAAVWLDRARLEWASVPAFLELGAQLAASGAPAELIARARAAATDELRHAVLSGQAAIELGGLDLLSLDPPSASPARAPLVGTPGLVRLAVESFFDGCVGEAAAAEQAAREATEAVAPALARTQSTIAADEARHADLAWDVLAWTLAADRAAVAPALRSVARAAVPAAPAADASTPAPSAAPGEARRWGVLDPRAGANILAERAAQARARLLLALADNSQGEDR